MYFPIKKESDFKALTAGYDGMLVIYAPSTNVNATCPVQKTINNAAEYDASITRGVAILPVKEFPGGRLVAASTGEIDPDYHDVRQFRDAAAKGIKRALEAGIRKPLVCLQSNSDFEDAELVSLLGIFEALHVPIQVRELKPKNLPTIEFMGVLHKDPAKVDKLISVATILEEGRIIARDIGDGDPERMTPMKVRQYVEQHLKETCIKITVVDDEETFRKEYPLFEAVNRAASLIERHKGCIIYLEYDPGTPVKETLMLVGKGVTYDTGGADIKAGGVMAGMSRDKCGAAAVAGFMKIVSLVRPKDLKVVAAMSMVRNSVGANCYVSDELIKARSGELVRVGNTDAEGRMIMADVLCRMKELAVDMVNPQLFTIATLTGHACITVGDGYSIIVDNGPSRKAGVSGRLQKAGDVWGDPFEVSTLRREDLAFHRGKAVGDDIMQSNNLPSTRTPRGHQAPAAFLLLASGLDKCGSGSKTPLKYSHLDIASSGGNFPSPSTGAPVIALAKAYVL